MEHFLNPQVLSHGSSGKEPTESRVDQSDFLLHVTALWLAKLIMNLLDQQIRIMSQYYLDLAE